MAKQILIAALSDLATDPRVSRQLAALRPSYRLTTAAYGPATDSSLPFVPLSKPQVRGRRHHLATELLRLCGRCESAYWRDPWTEAWKEILSQVDFDAAIVNNPLLLPATMEIAGNRPVVFDAHEYAPSENALDWRWNLSQRRMLWWILEAYLPRTSARTVPCAGAGRLYERDFGLPFSVVTNACRYESLQPSPVDPSNVRLVHWGIADPQRSLERTLEAMILLGPRYTLDLLLVPGSQSYLNELRAMGQGISNVRFLPRVPMEDLPRFGNSYDIGAFLLPVRHENQLYALPNKFFEFTQARLAVAVGPAAEMQAITKRFDYGISALQDTAESFAEAITSISIERLEELKRNSDAAAKSYNAEADAETIRNIMGQVIGDD